MESVCKLFYDIPIKNINFWNKIQALEIITRYVYIPSYYSLHLLSALFDVGKFDFNLNKPSTTRYIRNFYTNFIVVHKNLILQ